MHAAERLRLGPRALWAAFGLLFAIAAAAADPVQPAVGAASAVASEAAPAAADPELEARVMRIAAELRCLVCQNQTIADSNAELAQDLRQQVREQLRAGRSQAQILEYMTARYGDFVLYRPPLKSTTALLWFGPGVLLVGGLAVLGLVLYRRSRLPADSFEADNDPDAAPAASNLRRTE